MTDPAASRLGLGAAMLGTVLLMAAAIWWWLVFRQIVLNAYMTVPRALPCLLGESVVCRLAQALCASDHILGIRRYHAVLFWIGAVLLSIGLISRMRSVRNTGPAAGR